MDLVPIEYKYYDFVRELRMNPLTQEGFLEEAQISKEEQEKYMIKHGQNYYVCLLYGVPVGYIGVLEDDIRFCTHPAYQGRGVGSYMLREAKKLYPNATGRIKKDNIASQRAFDKADILYTLI